MKRITGAKRRLLDRLKLDGPSTAVALAGLMGLTDVAVRQHLQGLEDAGLVEQRARPPSGRGRPSLEWALTPLADSLFPDRHADLTLDLIGAARSAFGERGLDRLIGARTAAQAAAYRLLLPVMGPLARRVRALARLRTAEGYMAEVLREGRGSYLLVENHCPVSEAARTCSGLCSGELTVFQETLGEDVSVERIEHLLAGDRRCVYRIRPGRKFTPDA